ncbi:MAG: hypothetical protein ACFFDN_44090 [Candidatus Hodarchaeota archaeon]
MGKYLILWEVDQTKIPIDRKERGMGWSGLINLVKGDIKRGLITDWGAFVGETNGYGVFEATEVEIGIQLQKYVPFVIFKTYPIASVEQVEEVINTLKK